MEIARTRDVVVLISDKSFPVRLTDSVAQAGWAGGQGVSWRPSTSDEFLVGFSDGSPGGFLLWGSNEASDQFISMTQNQPTYQFGLVCVGTWVITTSSFERYTLQSRLVPPLVENVYVPGTQVRFSLRGLFTSQDEWALSADPRAPNDFFVGMVIQAPNTENSNYLMVQTML